MEEPGRGAGGPLDVARHWDENADGWARQVRQGLDAYREEFNNPAFFDFLGDISGRAVLDAGCGEGTNTRLLAEGGADVTGVDISPKMISLAREAEAEASRPLGIRYLVRPFEDLESLADGSFDVVVSFMALMDGGDVEGAIAEMTRVLRPGGRLVFSITHPCFITPGVQWVRDEAGREIALRVADYFSDEPFVEHWRFKGVDTEETQPFAVPRFPRTLSQWVNTLLRSGLSLTRIEEPRPSAEAAARHPWLQRWRQHAAIFLYVEASKPV